jgi:hypothetical protein
MGRPHFGDQLIVVVAQLCEHIHGGHEPCIVVLDALQAALSRRDGLAVLLVTR